MLNGPQSPDKATFVIIGNTDHPVCFKEHDLLQAVHPDIVGRRALGEPGIVFVEANELDVVVIIVKV